MVLKMEQEHKALKTENAECRFKISTLQDAIKESEAQFEKYKICMC